MKALQGFPLAGNPLRIEFAKAVSCFNYLLLLLLLLIFDLLVSENTCGCVFVYKLMILIHHMKNNSI